MRLIMLVIALLFAAPAMAQDTDARLDTVFGEHESFADVFEILQAAVANDDRETVASLVKYPFELTRNGGKLTFRSEKTFVERYDWLIEPIRDVILGQAYDSLFVNQDGVMFGNGELWLTSICLDDACGRTVWLISAINLPGEE